MNNLNYESQMQMEEHFKHLSKHIALNDEKKHSRLYTGDDIKRFLPHRDPFLFVDTIHHVDFALSTIHCSYQLEPEHIIFSGHFPNNPIFPGVLQIEAIGQAGILFYLLREQAVVNPQIAITHVMETRFIRTIIPPCRVYLNVTLLEEGLFFLAIGQCVVHDAICSVSSLQGIF